MYPCRYKSSSKLKKLFVSRSEGAFYRIKTFFESRFSPVKLYMDGWISDDEYKNISKYNIVKLRLYNTSNTPLIVRVMFRMLFRSVLKLFRKVILD